MYNSPSFYLPLMFSKFTTLKVRVPRLGGLESSYPQNKVDLT